MGSLETLWLMLAYAPVAPAPPPAVPPSADVVAPTAAPAEPSPESMAPAPAPEAVADAPAETPAALEPPSQTVSPTASPEEPSDAVDPVAEELPLDATGGEPNEPAATKATPHTVTLVHREAVSSSRYEQRYDYDEEDSFEEYFVSGYGGIITRGSAVSGKMGVLRGFHGGLLLGDRLSIGLAYHRLKRRFGAPILDASDRPLALEMAYGGLEIGATVFRRGRFELGVQTLFGGGAGCVTYDVNGRSNVAECVDSVRMMVLEPSALANIRVTDWMRVGVEGGYRGVARSSWSEGNDFDLGGGFFGLNLDFGWFARPND